jgi:hypothetical protein
MQKNPTKKSYANMPGPSRSLSRVHRAAPHSRHSREINPTPRRFIVALAALLAAVSQAAFAATPTPAPATSARPVRIDVTKIQPKSLLPKHVEHTEFVVEVNKLGQVTRIRSQRPSDNPTFNAQTYGNALQTFIRTPDGHVVLGIYRLTYDFDPKTARVRRDVSLVRQGGVNPDAKGAALVLSEKARMHPGASDIMPRPQSSVDPQTLPELRSVIAPTATPSPSHP